MKRQLTLAPMPVAKSVADVNRNMAIFKDEILKLLTQIDSGGETKVVRQFTGNRSATTTVNHTTSGGLIGPQGPQGPKGDRGDQGPKGEDGLGSSEDVVLMMARQAPSAINAIPPTNIAYQDYNGITSHNKTIAYDTLDRPVQTIENFVYGGETWTVTKTISYNGDLPSVDGVHVARI